MGDINGNAITEYCYNIGEVVAECNYVGGLIGMQRDNSTLSNSYNIFRIQEGNTRSNLTGNISDNVNVTNCYYLGDTTSDYSRTEADMKTTEFINLIGGESIWKLDSNNINNGFVILSWQ